MPQVLLKKVQQLEILGDSLKKKLDKGEEIRSTPTTHNKTLQLQIILK